MECIVIFQKEETDSTVPAPSILPSKVISKALSLKGIDGVAAIMDQGGKCPTCNLSIIANWLPTDELHTTACPQCGNPVKIGHRYTVEERLSLKIAE